jgi:hypothetical protein
VTPLIEIGEEVLDSAIHHSIVVLEVPPVELVQLSALPFGEVDDRLLDAQWQPQLNRVAVRPAALAGCLGRRLCRT